MKIKPLAESRVAEILLVEDNEDDVFLTREAFDAAGLRVSLHHVDNGEKCLQFLRKTGHLCRHADTGPDFAGHEHAGHEWP